MSNSISDKLREAAVKSYEIYNVGYEKGKYDASLVNNQIEYERGIQAGRKAEHDEFWNSYQLNGTRTNYRYAFNFSGWTEDNFKPKYDVIADGEITQMFNNSNINADLVEICEKQGIVMDFSKITQFEYVFQNSKFTRVGVIDAGKATKFVSVFYGATKLVTIDKIIISSKCTNMSTSFNNCTALENVRFEGTISQNGLNMKWSPLSYESLSSIINCLQDKSSDTSGTIWKVTIGGTNLAKLSESDLNIIEEKGWVFE